MPYSHRASNRSSEVAARTTLEQLPRQSQLSGSIPHLRARRPATLETDADDLEEKAKRVDGVRRRIQTSRAEEDLLREESNKLTAKLRHLVDQIIHN